jgi:hypothetical protein
MQRSRGNLNRAVKPEILNADFSPTLDDGEMSFSPSDTEAEADAHEELLSFISKLDPEKKRKAEDDDVQVPRPRKRRMIKEQTEGGFENEFSAQSAGMFSFILPRHLNPYFHSIKARLS